jgi:hypothetical protein
VSGQFYALAALNPGELPGTHRIKGWIELLFVGCFKKELFRKGIPPLSLLKNELRWAGNFVTLSRDDTFLSGVDSIVW